WCACSPDLNLIEGVWRTMKEHINCQVPQPQNNESIQAVILDEWDAIDEDDLNFLVLGTWYGRLGSCCS
ncbi:hypothetical protein L873DRAFT_1720271, partial [Choiromyces venosus 120613-1]